MRKTLFKIAVALSSFMLPACQTARTVSFSYHDATSTRDADSSLNRTSVLFLIDGLSSSMLRTALQTQAAPNIADAFLLTSQARFRYGRAVFPSLTFPNIASILTGRSVADQPIIGNRMFIDGKLVDFENIANWHELALELQRRTIFYQLAIQSQSSVSYSYAFSGGATAYQDTSPATALSYLADDTAAIDTQTLESLQSLLKETQLSRWPRFIFVHLIGVDAVAHEAGPQDERVQNYLHLLDRQLGAIFKILDHPSGLAASTREVNYALTSDHGFKATPDHSPLSEVVAHMNRKVRLIADNRVAPLFIDEAMSETDRLGLAKALLQVPHVGWAAVRIKSGIDLISRSGDHFMYFSGPENGPRNGPKRGADSSAQSDDDSLIIPALVNYFDSPQAPDMVFVPDGHSDFASGYKGNHGGFSRDEMLVPVLTKGVDMPRGIQPVYDLIKTMGVGK